MSDTIRRFLEQRIPDTEIRERQLEQFEIERASLEAHLVEARRMISNLLTKDAGILVMDVSQEIPWGKAVGDEDMVKVIQERQFGGETFSHGALMRHILGFEPDDPRVTIWDVAKDPELLKSGRIPYPDVWVGTGGPAMPSELHRGNETKNTLWLQRAVEAQKALAKLNIPGIAICLSHQLFHHGRGAQVGRLHETREVGTVDMTATPEGEALQLLYGFWDDEGKTEISATHSEAVITPPKGDNYHVVAMNDYSGFQGAVHPLNPREPIDEAIGNDNIVLTLQNHPEALAIYLDVLRYLRGDAMRKEGLDPDRMVFRDTPKARNVWLRFIELAARRIQERKK